jgi:hypothetical protein
MLKSTIVDSFLTKEAGKRSEQRILASGTGILRVARYSMEK